VIIQHSSIVEAGRALAPRIRRTPLLSIEELSAPGSELRVKCENLQIGGSFKARGALHFLGSLSPGPGFPGVITYSSGNHGRAVALAARSYGTTAVVVMPTTAPAVKIRGAEEWGARVILEGTTSLERMARAEAIMEEEGRIMVPPFDHPWTITGQGTVGLEILEDWDEVDTVLVPVGGGGLLAGVAAALRPLRPSLRIVGVEPEGAAGMRAAMEAGHPVTLTSNRTIADGLAPVRVGELPAAHALELGVEIVVVPDAAIREAARFLLFRERMVVEYSGAATLAARLSGAVGGAGRVVAILSGGNLDPAILAEWVSTPLG